MVTLGRAYERVPILKPARRYHRRCLFTLGVGGRGVWCRHEHRAVVLVLEFRKASLQLGDADSADQFVISYSADVSEWNYFFLLP